MKEGKELQTVGVVFQEATPLKEEEEPSSPSIYYGIPFNQRTKV